MNTYTTGTVTGVKNSPVLGLDSALKVESDARFNRSAGSPDSLVSESSTASNSSFADMISTAESQAAASEPGSTSEKPPHSYIALISMAILSTREKRILLGDLCQYIMDTFPYYNNQVRAWRNSIRHNLSINECFVKNGRSDNGKGNYWSIHPACVEDFAKGDYRRRQARRRARKGAKEVNNKRALPTQENIYGYGYTPMAQSPLGHQNALSSSVRGYQPMTSSVVRYEPMTSYPADRLSCSPAQPAHRSPRPVSSGYHPYQRPITSHGAVSRVEDPSFFNVPAYLPEIRAPVTSYPQTLSFPSCALSVPNTTLY